MLDGSQIEASKPRPTQSLESKSAPKLWWLLAAILLVALSCFRFPHGTITQQLDPSWSGVLVYAHETGLQFGRDIVFTYGPLGLFSISCFLPQAAVARMVFEVAMGLGIASGLCLVAWRMAFPWRCVLLGFFIFVSMPLHWGGDALLVDLGIFAWGLLCFLESGPRLTMLTVPLVVLVVIGALMKFTFLVTGLFTIVLLASDLALRGRRALAAGILIGLVLAFSLGWLLLGQSLTGVGAFLSTSYSVADGYNRAMGSDYGDVTLILIMVATALAAAAIRCLFNPGSGTRFDALRRALLLFWIAGLLFVNWKHVCVRADFYHVELLFGFMPLVAICMQALPASRRRAALWSSVAGLLCLFAAVLIISSQIDEKFFPFNCIKTTWSNMSKSSSVLLAPAQYLRGKTEAFDAEQKREQLPKISSTLGRATADVFGQNQAYAFANKLNYEPRPVFQSYSAYSRQMMALNEQFYLSPNAPEYVLFNLQPIDGRFPALEDAFVLRDLLINYQLAFSEGDFLLLQRKSAAAARLTLIKEGTIRVGEKLDLSPLHGTNLWLEIELQPTLLGRLWQFLYKPQEALLVARRQADPGPGDKFCAPAAMLAAGFLASPMEMENKDVMRLYSSDKVILPDSYSVELVPSLVSGWQPRIRYRIYRVENKLGTQ